MALLPQEELLEDGMQVLPPGLNAVILPYADEVREPKAPEDGDIKPEGKLTFHFLFLFCTRLDPPALACGACLLGFVKVRAINVPRRSFSFRKLNLHTCTTLGSW